MKRKIVDFKKIFKNCRTYYEGIFELGEKYPFHTLAGNEILCLIAGCEKPLKAWKLNTLLGYPYRWLEDGVDMLRFTIEKIIKRDRHFEYCFTDGKKAQSVLEQVSPFAKKWYSDMDKHFDLIALINTIKKWGELGLSRLDAERFVISLAFNDFDLCFLQPSEKDKAKEVFNFLCDKKKEFRRRFLIERERLVEAFNATEKPKQSLFPSYN